MKVREVMQECPATIPVSQTVKEAAARMRFRDVGVLPVLEDDDEFAGVVTDRDITLRVTAAGRDPCEVGVWEAMTPNVVRCTDEDEVDYAAQLMRRHHIRRLPVVQSQDERLVGILSVNDLAGRPETARLSRWVLEGIANGDS